MEKRKISILSITVAIILLSIVIVGCTSVPANNTEINVTEKVRFEGIGTITNESSSEIAALGNFVSTRSVYINSGKRIRIAFASLVNNNNSSNTSLVTDYDLCLYDSNGIRVGSSITQFNNEFIDYEVKTSGTYTIKIRQFSAKKTTMPDYCSYTYFID